jgi:hypothetical protein
MTNPLNINCKTPKGYLLYFQQGDMILPVIFNAIEENTALSFEGEDCFGLEKASSPNDRRWLELTSVNLDVKIVSRNTLYCSPLTR